MNRNQLKEVNSLHLNKAGETKKQKLNQDYYQQNKEDINRKRREKYQTQKQSDEKNVDKRLNTNEKVNVNKCQQSSRRDYHRKYKADQKAQTEGLNSGSPLLEERTDKDFLEAKRLITWLEEIKAKEENFPRQWLKERLAKESEEFRNAFSELLKNNRSQYRNIPKLRLPLTLKTLQQWQSEPQPTTKPEIKVRVKAKDLRQFFYEPTHNRLWYQGKEVKTKTLTQWGRTRFVIENNPTTNSYFFLEPQLEKDWQLRVYGQKACQGELKHYRTFNSYQDTQVVSFTIQEWDEIIKNGAEKWEKKWNSGKDDLLLLSKGVGKTLAA